MFTSLARKSLVSFVVRCESPMLYELSFSVKGYSKEDFEKISCGKEFAK